MLALIEPHLSKGEGGPPALITLEAMRGLCLMADWVWLHDPAMEEACMKRRLRHFAGLQLDHPRQTHPQLPSLAGTARHVTALFEW